MKLYYARYFLETEINRVMFKNKSAATTSSTGILHIIDIRFPRKLRRWKDDSMLCVQCKACQHTHVLLSNCTNHCESILHETSNTKMVLS